MLFSGCILSPLRVYLFRRSLLKRATALKRPGGVQAAASSLRASAPLCFCLFAPEEPSCPHFCLTVLRVASLEYKEAFECRRFQRCCTGWSTQGCTVSECVSVCVPFVMVCVSDGLEYRAFVEVWAAWCCSRFSVLLSVRLSPVDKAAEERAEW